MFDDLLMLLIACKMWGKVSKTSILVSSGRPRHRWIRPLANLGPRSRLDVSGLAVRFIWGDSQAKPFTLNPVRTKSNVFGLDRNFVLHLTINVLLLVLPQALF